MTITIIEDLKNDVIQHIKKRNLIDLKKFIVNYKIDLKEFEKYGKEDLLFLAIKYDNPKEVINYIIEECQYDEVNYTVNSNSSTSPLGLAISRNNFKVADLLCDKYNADINYGNDMNRCFTYIYKNNTFQPKQLNYLLKRGYNFCDLSENIIKSMISYYQNDILKKILNNTIYDNVFIIKLLQQRKNGQVFTLYQWKQILKEEKQKIYITDEIYETVFNCQNWEALNLFLSCEGREQKVTIFDMIEEYEVMEKAISNGDIKTIKAISNFGYALSYKCFNFEDLIIKSYSKNNNDIWKILIKSSILSFKEKENKLMNNINSNLKSDKIFSDHSYPHPPDLDLSLKNMNIIEGDISIDYDYAEENDITNNIILKDEDRINYDINLSLNDNFTNIINGNDYIGKIKNDFNDAFIINSNINQDCIKDMIPIVGSAYSN
ncbi:hypothetical protein PIROE2DRAFT_60907 [Piromyces sp. E2]|nr:hypothetical protein PIROE2DRAFT_60907 [Piromyces sp. E2]|eukprot:OUM64083.1 hypothetical protein PIROE2DRAFT_60907 [Piromyces sp. E2]